MTVHYFPLAREALQGVFDRAFDPVLTVDSGDTVVFRTLAAGWGRAEAEIAGIPREITPDPRHEAGHALCGPVAVRGAEPGDTLEIQIVAVRPSAWGGTFTGPRPHLPRYDMGLVRGGLLAWDIDPDAGIATNREHGISVPIRPFMGVMGNAPAEPGPHSTTPPRRVGGNIDCRELTAGSTLRLPVEVPGALFSVGDGHAAQGDGEVGQTAIECAMQRVELTFRLRPGEYLATPEAITPSGFVTMGFAKTLDDAAAVALDAMLAHIRSAYALEQPEALALASVVVDLRVTQIVNGRSVGVHAVLPRDRVSLST